jgi:Mg-chelatase subunit ChlD
VQAALHSTHEGFAHLLVMRNGVLLHETRVELQPGINVYGFPEQADKPGLQEYEVIVNAEADSEQENNRYQAFVQVLGAPKVLHAMGDGESGRYVSAALRAQGLAVDEVRAAALPSTMHELVDYDLVILDNVSGFDLSLAKMELLEHYVRDAGGGVVKIGGDKSYAAGGYYGTPVERLLPVTMNVKTEVKIPSLAVIFVLDRSGSMGTKAQGEEKLAIAKRAALLSIDLLNRLDRVGVLAFDSGREWVVPPTEAAMRRPIAEKLLNLKVGGGTDLHQALEEAYRVMRQEQAKVKHLIVLSDGITDGEKNFDRLGKRIAADGITISTIAMGSDADKNLMAQLSELGKGRFYHTEDPANVPRIFTSEALTITRELVVEGKIQPRQVGSGELLQGFEAFPPLRGYQRAFAKPAAHVLLAAADDDPLLATWRYGLGKAAAFTSDLSGRWGRHWVEWPEFGRFVAQTARWTMRRSPAQSFLPTFAWQGSRGEMRVDVLDQDERFVNGLALEASVLDPSRDVRRLPFEQIAPGRYRVEFPVAATGRYYVTLSGREGSAAIGPRTFGLAVPYSAEFLDPGVDRKLLSEVAGIAGGRLLPLETETLDLVTAATPHAIGPRAQVWWPLVLLGLVLVLLEVAVRRLSLPEAWQTRWQRWRETRRGRAGAEPDYDTLRAGIAEERARHQAAARTEMPLDPDDPAARARLYQAARRGGREGPKRPHGSI